MQKIHKYSVNFALILVLMAGALEFLLIGRLVARLLAARPDNPAFALLYGITGPLVAPFAALDYDQPPFGAALEFSTLTLAMLVPLVAYLGWAWLRARATLREERSS